MALWASGRGRAWGWMIGNAVQPGWIAYALLTDQPGFVIGCVIFDGRAVVRLSEGHRGDYGRPGSLVIQYSVSGVGAG
jgi:hypothetical protein